MPLGVLKSHDLEFRPGLPQEHSRAIKNLGSGILEKLVIRFDEVFWNKDCDWLNFISEEPYEWTQTLNLYKFTGEPILVMFNCERSALKFASLSNEALLEKALSVLAVMFPAKAPTLRDSIIDYRRTNWSQDRYARMCYTYMGVHSSPEDLEILGRPLGDGKVWFAGEHTQLEFMGTVHAAYISGIKAGERLIGLYT